MKTLKLSQLNLDNAEVLSREELRKVLGGMGSGGSGGDNNKCQVITTDSEGHFAGSYTLSYSDGTSCSSLSYSTSVWASAHIPTGGSAHYDCGCDGWGS